jgi:hypothetical protein
MGSAGKCVLAAVIAVLGVVFADGAAGAVTTFDEHGTVVVDGRKVFPIVLAKGPEHHGVTPTGANALDEVVDAGVNFFKVGPAADPWLPADKQDALDWNRAAAARGVYTWVNLATVSDAHPVDRPVKNTRLREVITLLEGDVEGRPALAMWKGADEPFWAGWPPERLQYAYCVATSRGEDAWCLGQPTADSEHLWVTIQAPRGTAEELAPYSAVTDIHGVDHYPVTWADQADPNLNEVGDWTATIASVTPNKSVWTTLQVCASGSSNPNDPAEFVLPTRHQERFMVYDAILNGARSLAFYGGNIFRCWNTRDEALSWNWTFWETVLEDLVREINEASPIAPALVNPGSTKTLGSSDPTTQVMSREGLDGELWVIAARSGEGSQQVTISGLPATLAGGTVYTEGRSIAAANGSFTDTFAKWDVHVYRFPAAPAAPPPPAPSPPPTPSPAPPAPPPPPAEPQRVRDTTPPNTRITAAPNRRVKSRRARFRFKATEVGSRFRCKLDRRAWAACRSPQTYRRLRKGVHVFRVRALDAAGNADRTPAARSWRIR